MITDLYKSSDLTSHRPYPRQFVAGHGQLSRLPTAIIICQERIKNILTFFLLLLLWMMEAWQFNHFTSNQPIQHNITSKFHLETLFHK